MVGSEAFGSFGPIGVGRVGTPPANSWTLQIFTVITMYGHG